MTANTDAPRPALGELARLATEAGPALFAHAWFTPEFLAIALQCDTRHAEFIAACSPAVVLQLVALASGGADARLKALTEVHEFYEFDAVDEEQFDTWLHERIKECRVARSLTPERPADAVG